MTIDQLQSQVRTLQAELLGRDFALKSRLIAHYEHVFVALVERGIRAEQAHEQALSAKALLFEVLRHEIDRDRLVNGGDHQPSPY